MENIPFNGLTMPVFSAFGWAEEAALEYALTQLEQFAQELNRAMSMEARGLLPQHGVDKQSRTAYLSAGERPEDGLHIVFEARPMALKTTVILTDREALQKALRTVETTAIQWHRALIELDPEWHLRIQQMEYEPETDVATHYKDVFKNPVNTLTPETTSEVLARAAYLNSEEKWLAPIYITRRTASEFIAAMGRSVVDVMVQEIELLLPVLRLLGSPVRRVRTRSKSRRPAARVGPAVQAPVVAEGDQVEQFTYVAEMKPLHIRKGFINLTPEHWPFFAVNSRTETRDVTVYFGDGIDKRSAVWRLVPNDMARLVLGREAHDWIEENCSADDQIEITATKAPDDSIDIQIRLLD